MSKKEWGGAALLAPVPPALVTCAGTDENGERRENILTVAWTGIINSHPARTYISVRPERYSYGLIKESGEFVINLTTEALARAADFCGVRSGREMDKFEKCALHTERAFQVGAPVLAESPVSLECRVFDVIPLGSHDMFLADIVAVGVDESLISAEGRLMLERASLVAYSHGDYFTLGKRIGGFGYSVRKKKTGKRKK